MTQAIYNHGDIILDWQSSRYTLKEIASIHECSASLVSYVINAAFPDREKRKQRAWTNSGHRKVIDTVKSGKSFTQTARALGLTKGQVAGIIYRNAKD